MGPFGLVAGLHERLRAGPLGLAPDGADRFLDAPRDFVVRRSHGGVELASMIATHRRDGRFELAGVFDAGARNPLVDSAGDVGLDRADRLVGSPRALRTCRRNGFLETACGVGLGRGNRFLRAAGGLGLCGHSKVANDRSPIIGSRLADVGGQAVELGFDLARQLPSRLVDDLFDLLFECHTRTPPMSGPEYRSVRIMGAGTRTSQDIVSDKARLDTS